MLFRSTAAVNINLITRSSLLSGMSVTPVAAVYPALTSAVASSTAGAVCTVSAAPKKASVLPSAVYVRVNPLSFPWLPVDPVWMITPFTCRFAASVKVRVAGYKGNSPAALSKLNPSVSPTKLSVSLARSVSSAPVCVGVMSSKAIPFRMLSSSPVQDTPSPPAPAFAPMANVRVPIRPVTATFLSVIAASSLVRPVISVAVLEMEGAVSARV
mmetsp:Transcript_59133/g.136433  ORF Transcript_59133/g.136433 Transcript_59133/m.136433 type:complete len:213 (-) Transcript_59133:1890-2528(-)